MANKPNQKDLERQERHIRRLYALIWLLACPMAFIVARLLGFQQINIVYWTLLVVPILLAIYNVRQVPPIMVKSVPAVQGDDESAEISTPMAEPVESVSRFQHTRMLLTALKFPAVIAVPILLTVVIDLCIQ